MLYPGQRHGVRGKALQLHQFRMWQDFFGRSWGLSLTGALGVSSPALLGRWREQSMRDGGALAARLALRREAFALAPLPICNGEETRRRRRGCSR
jgi:hypothetical protein